MLDSRRTWAEVEALLHTALLVEQHPPAGSRIKEVRLLTGWAKPLHVVRAVDHEKRLIVYITVCEPDLQHWLPGFTERRR